MLFKLPGLNRDKAYFSALPLSSAPPFTPLGCLNTRTVGGTALWLSFLVVLSVGRFLNLLVYIRAPSASGFELEQSEVLQVLWF